MIPRSLQANINDNVEVLNQKWVSLTTTINVVVGGISCHCVVMFVSLRQAELFAMLRQWQ